MPAKSFVCRFTLLQPNNTDPFCISLCYHDRIWLKIADFLLLRTKTLSEIYHTVYTAPSMEKKLSASGQ